MPPFFSTKTTKKPNNFLKKVCARPIGQRTSMKILLVPRQQRNYTTSPGKPVLGQLVDDYLLDFDIFHVSHVTELLHYIEPKYLSGEIAFPPIPLQTYHRLQPTPTTNTFWGTETLQKSSRCFLTVLKRERP